MVCPGTMTYITFWDSAYILRPPRLRIGEHWDNWPPDSWFVVRHYTGDHLMGCCYYVWTVLLSIEWCERFMRESMNHIWEGICWPVRSWGLAISGWLWRRIAASSFRDVLSVRYMEISFTCRPPSCMHWLHHGHFLYGVLTSYGGRLVTLDYFTKWVEAASYVRLTSSGVASFIRSHIIYRYGVPHELIFDKGVHCKADFDALLQRYGIQHHRSFVYR